MRRPLLGLLLVASWSFAACSDETETIPTQPRPQVVSEFTPCDPDLAADIESEIDALLSGAVRSEAKKQFQQIKKDCPRRRGAAVDKAVNYAEFFIAQFASIPSFVEHPNGSGLVPREELSAEHLTHLFGFVGETPDPPLDPSVFTDEGAITVCGPTAECRLKTGTDLAGIVVPVGAISDRHLFAIAPLPNSACSRENLDLIPLCFEFTVVPVTTFNPPYVTGTVCHDPGFLDEDVVARSRLAHPDPANQAAILLAPFQFDPFALHCEHHTASRSRFGIRDANPAVALWHQARRLAWTVYDVFRPQPLFAPNTVGGKIRSFSPFGMVDPLIFQGTFTDDAVGQPPGTDADKGTWFVFATPPGSILVQNSIADLDNKPVVLSQGGGNCAQCGGLELRGTVKRGPASNPFPTTGIYLVRWRSVQTKPSIKRAPFVLRANGPGGPILATLEYRSVQSSKVLTFNGRNVGAWTQNVAQTIVITVDLNADRTSLSLCTGRNCVPAPVSNAQRLNFVDRTVTNPNLAQLAAEFSGIDSGIMGWDDITITRQEDALP